MTALSGPGPRMFGIWDQDRRKPKGRAVRFLFFLQHERYGLSVLPILQGGGPFDTCPLSLFYSGLCF